MKRFAKPLGILAVILAVVTITCVTVSAITSCLPEQDGTTQLEGCETTEHNADMPYTDPTDSLPSAAAVTAADTETGDDFTGDFDGAAKDSDASENTFSDNDDSGFAEEPQNSDTYIKISLSRQHLWLYEDGSLLIDTPVVTGNDDGEQNTPSGCFSIQDRETDITLVGDDYEKFVSYWIGFNGGIGIHDADWREDFGGDIYRGYGSHGCINVPCDIAEIIYEHTDYDTLVYVD